MLLQLMVMRPEAAPTAQKARFSHHQVLGRVVVMFEEKRTLAKPQEPESTLAQPKTILEPYQPMSMCLAVWTVQKTSVRRVVSSTMMGARFGARLPRHQASQKVPTMPESWAWHWESFRRNETVRTVASLELVSALMALLTSVLPALANLVSMSASLMTVQFSLVT